MAGAGYYIWDAGYIQDFIGSERTHDKIIVYSSAECRICENVIKTIEQEGFPVTVFNIDQDPDAYELLRETLQEAGTRRQTFELPVVDIRGKVLTSAPSPRKVRENLPKE